MCKIVVLPVMVAIEWMSWWTWVPSSRALRELLPEKGSALQTDLLPTAAIPYQVIVPSLCHYEVVLVFHSSSNHYLSESWQNENLMCFILQRTCCFHLQYAMTSGEQKEHVRQEKGNWDNRKWANKRRQLRTLWGTAKINKLFYTQRGIKPLTVQARGCTVA